MPGSMCLFPAAAEFRDRYSVELKMLDAKISADVFPPHILFPPYA